MSSDTLKRIEQAAKRFDFYYNSWRGEHAQQDAEAILAFLKERYKLKGRVENHEGEVRILIHTRRTYWQPSTTTLSWNLEHAKELYDAL